MDLAQLAENRIQRCLASLSTLIDYASAWEGRKELFFFSDGFPLNPTSFYVPRAYAPGFESDVLHLAQEAATAQLAIYPIDTMGLRGGLISDAVMERVSN